jgi:hypothetical protein
VPVFTTNAQGQVTSVTNTAIGITSAAVSGLAASATTDTTNAANITTGTLNTARLSGSYTGITGVGTLAAGTWNGSVIGAIYGGTGFASYTVGDLLFADTTTSLAKLAGAAVGNALISGGVASAPSYGKIGLATHVSGTLPVANGGTGLTSLGAGVATFLGTPSSANLAAAVTDETGSGALVFATSPTFVTPALGTPSSGNLANCTFPTLNQNTTGSAATLTTARTINGVSFNGSANITVTANTTNTLTLGTGLGGTSFNGSSAVTATVSYGTSAGTACQGNDARLTDSRQATNTNTQLASLGVGTAASGTAGEIRATNNITAYYSDDRLKTKLGNIENALDKVRSLSGFYYEANEVAQAFGYEVKREVGVSAQQVQAVQPEVVAPAPIDENYLTVRYERLVPLLIEAIKELDGELQSIKQQLKGD